jgi:hypothetical protein
VDRGIDYFQRNHWLSGIQARVSLVARRRMFELFLQFTGEVGGQTILDVGATPDIERSDSNCMITWFHEKGFVVALYSPENIEHLRERFTFARIVPSSGFGKPIPCENQSQDWVSSSAVLEHVGSRGRQEEFLRDCARVSRRGLFVTTPNRGHWLEFHTKLPLIHWLPKPVHRRILRRAGLKLWAEETHLNLLGRQELHALAASALSSSFDWHIASIRTFGMPSNLVLLARRT